MSTRLGRSMQSASSLTALFVIASGTVGAQTGPPVGKPAPTLYPTGVTRPTALPQSNALHLDKPEEVPIQPVIDNQALTKPDYEMLQQLLSVHTGTRAYAGDIVIEPMGGSPFYVTAGLNMTDTAGWYPPDCSVAIGPASAVQPVNSTVRTYSRSATGLTAVTTHDANTFMNWGITTPFDCRALYDSATGHFFVSFQSFQYQDANGGWHQNMLLAVSKTNDATGAWWTYNFDTIPIMKNNPNFVAGDVPFFDFPMLGIDANNVYITGNIFGNYAYYGSTLLAYDKKALESGGGANGYYWNNLNGTLTVPNVTSAGTKGNSYFIFPQEFSTSIGVYALTGAVTAGKPTFTGPYNVTVPYYTPPPPAAEPDGSQLDAIDGRFQDKTTQIGDIVYAAQTVGDSGYDDVAAYAINAFTATLLQSTTLYTAGASYDFNPSITANPVGTAVVNWDYTIHGPRGSAGTYESVRVQMLKATATKPWPKHAAGIAVPGATSTVTSYLGRNGDYSMIMVDPLNSKQFWGINQATYDNYDWNTFIFSYKTP